ncbi:immune inhibitor A domain-containing protein [Neobacillus sp. M.A.Huq-85]
MVKWKKVLGSSLLSAGLAFSSFAPATFAKEVKGKNVQLQNPHNMEFSQPTGNSGKLPFLDQHTGGPFDEGLINEDKVLKLLIKQGIVDKKASLEEQHKQMYDYISKRAEKAEIKGTNQQEIKRVRAKLQEKKKLKLKPAGALIVDKKVNPKVSSGKKVGPIQEEKWTGTERKDKVLVLLIDYPDYPHNSIKPEDGSFLYYKDYTQQHYQDMIFGDNGYSGPDGQNLLSVKQYYEQQSGGSYTIDGQVSKWYTAKNPAAYYGGNDPAQYDNDKNPQALVFEALTAAAQDPAINLADYDKEDQYDLDGDGNYREPDGIIDHLMVIHSGIGEEAGGGALGNDAIWSHSWDLGQPVKIPNSDFYGYTYTIEPEDGASGVFAHEFGHDLGLPDEYDTAYTKDGVGAPTEYWTIMSSGSWAGTIPGTEPTGFSPYDKEYLQGVMPGSNWFKNTEYKLTDLKSEKNVLLDEASVKGTNQDGIKIQLPDKPTKVNTPASGKYEYFSGSGNNLFNGMITAVDLTGKTSAQLKFKTWYNIEQDFDYAYVGVSLDGVNFTPLSGNITTTSNPYGGNFGNGITGDSKGWKDAVFDLSALKGQKFYLVFAYVADPYVAMPGLYADDIQVIANGKTILSDNADGAQSLFELYGFTKNKGITLTDNYYLLEWRNYAAADEALRHLTNAYGITYDPGALLWYVDNKYTDNWVGDHPGEGFLGVVDAHQSTADFYDSATNADLGVVPYSLFQIQDAAFSLSNTDPTYIDLSQYGAPYYVALNAQPAVNLFDDAKDYSNPGLIYAGRNVPKLGLKIQVTDQAEDKSVGTVKLSANISESVALNQLSKSVYSNKAGYNKVTISGKIKGLVGSSLKYEVLNSSGKVITSFTDTLTAMDQSFNETLTLPANTPTGNYAVKVTAGSASKQVSFKVDNDAPKVTASPNGSTTPVKEAQTKVTVSDANLGTLGYVWSQSTKAPSSGYKSFTNGSVLKQPGKNGKWYLYVQAKDKVGNSTTWKSNSFNLDSAKPTLTISPNGSTKPAKSVSPKVTVKDSNLSSYGYAWTKSAAAPKSGYKSFKNGSKLTLSKVTGKYYLHIYAKDKAGNTLTFNSKSFALDNTAPAKPQVDKIISKNKLVTGHAEKGTKITIKAGKTTVTGYVNSKGKYSIKLKNALKVGTTVYVTATDTAGNKSSAAKTTVKKK